MAMVNTSPSFQKIFTNFPTKYPASKYPGGELEMVRNQMESNMSNMNQLSKLNQYKASPSFQTGQFGKFLGGGAMGSAAGLGIIGAAALAGALAIQHQSKKLNEEWDAATKSIMSADPKLQVKAELARRKRKKMEEDKARAEEEQYKKKVDSADWTKWGPTSPKQ
jgi:hypothetical protein